ncbi:NUDIX hydrolase [Catellatospora sichuanensis]|uniref:NUDIX hydrolase n=1 Tax=Catellatospora sichuanensis TaxID=1969805 RepID=UPI0016433BD6|nr:NUDIX hydrolase [Catellatospora sichuanensis]
MNTPFEKIKLRTAAAVFCEGHVALIHREKDGIDQYTLPGGNVETGESLHDALRRELAEELRLDLDDEYPLHLIAVQDQMVSRPGPTAPPRKLHLVFAAWITPEQRGELALVEHDDLSPGAIVWVPAGEVYQLHLFPAVGEAITGADIMRSGPGVLLPALTDKTFQWV